MAHSHGHSHGAGKNYGKAFALGIGLNVIFIAVIVWGTWRLFTDSVDLALDAVPKHINLEKVREFLLA